MDEYTGAWPETFTLDDLKHHGIKGMRWGIRRYQNKDGSLTPAGKKRLEKLEAEREALTGKKSESSGKSSSSSSGPKKVSEMSDDELKTHLTRLRNERDYLDVKRQIAAMTPQTLTAGQKFAKMFNDSVVPAVTTAGRNVVTSWLEKKGKELLGLNTTDELGSLKKEVDKLDLQKRRKDLEDYLGNKDETARLRRENEAYEARKKNEEYQDYFSEESRAKREAKAQRDEFVDQAKAASNAATSINNFYKQRKDYYDKYAEESNSQETRETRDAGSDFIDQFLLEERRRNN